MAGAAEPRGEAAAAAARSFATNIRRALVDMLVRREDECIPEPGFDNCAKPGLASQSITWIVVGTLLGLLVVVTCAVLIWFHLRKNKREAREDVEDRFHMADYGLDEVPPGRKPRADDDEETISHDGSPNGSGRRHRDPLHPGAAHLHGHSNPFDDASSTGSGQAWPRREGSHPSPLGKEI